VLGPTMENGSTAEHIAEVVYLAVTDAGNQFRYEAGTDATQMLANRRAAAMGSTALAGSAHFIVGRRALRAAGAGTSSVLPGVAGRVSALRFICGAFDGFAGLLHVLARTLHRIAACTGDGQREHREQTG
jgi:hypothetical protein